MPHVHIKVGRQPRKQISPPHRDDNREPDGWGKHREPLTEKPISSLTTGAGHDRWAERASKHSGPQYARAGHKSSSDRSVAIELHENLRAIVAWRAKLPERERRRLISAQANVKRWHRDRRHRNGKCPTDLRRDADAAWKKFKWCVRCLPTHDREPLWQMVFSEAKARV